MGPNQTDKLLHSKGNQKENKKTTYRMGENSFNDAMDKGLISRIYKQLIQPNSKKANQSMEKWAKDMTRLFSKEDIQMASKHMKKMLNIADYKRMQIETTMRYYLTPVRMAIINKCTNNKCWRGCGEKGTLLQCWWECKLAQPLRRTV